MRFVGLRFRFVILLLLLLFFFFILIFTLLFSAYILHRSNVIITMV